MIKKYLAGITIKSGLKPGPIISIALKSDPLSVRSQVLNMNNTSNSRMAIEFLGRLYNI